jgi:hypothetical protein
MAQQAPLGEGSHHHDAHAQVRRERENQPLDVALLRVVGDLNSADASTFHEHRELIKGARAVMRGADGAQAPPVALGFEQRQMFAPVHEVVHLIEVHDAAVEAHRGVDLTPAFGSGRRPHLRRNERLRPARA